MIIYQQNSCLIELEIKSIDEQEFNLEDWTPEIKIVDKANKEILAKVGEKKNSNKILIDLTTNDLDIAVADYKIEIRIRKDVYAHTLFSDSLIIKKSLFSSK